MKVELSGDGKMLDAIKGITYSVGGVETELEMKIVNEEEVKDDSISSEEFVSKLTERFMNCNLSEKKFIKYNYTWVAFILVNDEICLKFGTAVDLSKALSNLVKKNKVLDFKAFYQSNSIESCKAVESYIILDMIINESYKVLNKKIDSIIL